MIRVEMGGEDRLDVIRRDPGRLQGDHRRSVAIDEEVHPRARHVKAGVEASTGTEASPLPMNVNRIEDLL
jgi:hypothetical protein